MIKYVAILVTVFAALLTLGVPTSAHARDDLRLTARLTATTGAAFGTAVYRERARGARLEQRFSIEVEHATPGRALGVRVAGVLIGTVVPNSFGRGQLEVHFGTDDPRQPASFPRLHAGSLITAGTLSGVLR